MSCSHLACALHAQARQLAQHSHLWQFSGPCQPGRLSHQSVPESPTPCDPTVIQSSSTDFSDLPPCLLLTSFPCCLSCRLRQPCGLKQKWVHPQSVCLGSQVPQVWIKWPNLFGIPWAVAQGRVHSGMSLSRADAASARLAKSPWVGFLVRGTGDQSPPPSHPHSTNTDFALIMSSQQEFRFPIPFGFFPNRTPSPGL